MSGSKYKQSPPQTGPYIVKVKNGAGWRSYDTARLQISVGMPYHEEEKLRATIEWVQYRFKKIIICINDTLQHYNLLYENPEMDKRDALIRTFEMGREWMTRNFNLIQSLPNFSLHHWDEWKQTATYPENLQKVYALYEDNDTFQQTVENNIAAHWRRKVQNGEITDTSSYQRFADCSRQYLLEETAIFGIMYEAERAADIYPGTLLVPVKYLQEHAIAGAPNGYNNCHHTRIDFKRNNGPS